MVCLCRLVLNEMDFSKAKQSRQKVVDLSKKGSIDDAIVPLVDKINSSSSYFTTSSCSGRICVFQEANGVQKKGCEWLYVTHGYGSNQELESCMSKITGDAFFKFEPFILHVQCSAIQKARVMHEAAIASGFRNSGISIGKKGKIMLAVRSTHGLEVPLSKEGRILINTEYLHHITELANEKMKENFRRIDRFTSNLTYALKELMEDEESDRNKSVEAGVRPKEESTTDLKDKKLYSVAKGAHHHSSGIELKNTDEGDFPDFSMSCLFDNV